MESGYFIRSCEELETSGKGPQRRHCRDRNHTAHNLYRPPWLQRRDFAAGGPMTRGLADQIIADTPEFKRRVSELESAIAEFRANPSEATSERWLAALESLSEQCRKMNAYMKPALEFLETIAPPRRKRRKARQ